MSHARRYLQNRKTIQHSNLGEKLRQEQLEEYVWGQKVKGLGQGHWNVSYLLPCSLLKHGKI